MDQQPIKIRRRIEVHTDFGRRRLYEELKRTANGFRVILEPIKKKKRTRDLWLYYTMIREIADWSGERADSLDHYFRETYCTPIIVEEFGITRRKRPGFEELQPFEKTQLIEIVRAVCAFLEIEVDQGDPNDGAQADRVA